MTRQAGIVISTYPQRAKTRNARRDPRVSLCVLSDDWDGPYVHVDGMAEVLDMPEALDGLIDYCPRGSPGCVATLTHDAPPRQRWAARRTSEHRTASSPQGCASRTGT